MTRIHNPDLPCGEVFHVKDDIYRIRRHYRQSYANKYFKKTICVACGKEIFATNFKRCKRHVCSPECKKKIQSGSNNCNWTGGRKFKSSGHIIIYKPDHPFAKKGYIPEHRYVVEQHIGRYLRPEEVVHHKNCNPKDNQFSNLIIVPKNRHSKIHSNLEKCIAELMKRGLIKFNTKKLQYEVIK